MYIYQVCVISFCVKGLLSKSGFSGTCMKYLHDDRQQRRRRERTGRLDTRSLLLSSVVDMPGGLPSPTPYYIPGILYDCSTSTSVMDAQT